MQKRCYANTPQPSIESVYGSATSSILAGNPKENYASFKNLASVTVPTVYNIKKNLKRRIRSSSIAGQLLDMTSNQRLCSTTYQQTPMERCLCRSQILEPVVRPWLEAKEDFVLEEDDDSGHGTSASNIVRKWKQTHGLEACFNCASSPDLASIENCWQPLEAHMRKYPHWSDNTIKELILEGWTGVSQKSSIS